MYVSVATAAPYLGDLGVCTAAVARGGVHPGALLQGALLPQRALLLLHAPAALEARVGLQTHAAAVPKRVALVQVRW